MISMSGGVARLRWAEGHSHMCSQLREEMELLADFERMQGHLTSDRVQYLCSCTQLSHISSYSTRFLRTTRRSKRVWPTVMICHVT